MGKAGRPEPSLQTSSPATMAPTKSPANDNPTSQPVLVGRAAGGAGSGVSAAGFPRYSSIAIRASPMSRSLRLESLSRQRRNNFFTVEGLFDGRRAQSGSFMITEA